MAEGSQKTSNEVVTDIAKSDISDLWKKEDYWAIWLGFFLIIAGMIIYFPRPPEGMREAIDKANATMQAEAERAPFHTVAWYEAKDAKGKPKAEDQDFAKTIKKWTSKPHGWKTNPVESFILGAGAAKAKEDKALEKYEKISAKTKELKDKAVAAEKAAEEAGFSNIGLNKAAEEAIEGWLLQKREDSAAKKKTKVKPYNQIPYLAGWLVIMAVLFGVGMQVMNGSGMAFVKAFPFVFLIAVISYVFAAQSDIKSYGIGYAAWAILFGLLISNTVGTPKWVMPAVQVEYYIKTGLVLLGAEILFGKILIIGVPGIFVAWIVTPIVLLATFWFGQRVLKMPSKTLNITISADMSVCGVSAAIATAAACRAKKEELTLAVGLSLVFTSVMMIVMPAVIKAVGMDHVLGGAWMGGTIDATGAVAAAGAFLSDRALYVAATIKMIQNILIGVIAFAVAVIWVTKVDRDPNAPAPSAWEIWYRFPKFVLGFIVASVAVSLIYEAMGKDVAHAMIDKGLLSGWTKLGRGWFFCLAFVSIGLATNFRELAHYFKGGKPLILYVCGQTFNLILTLVMAYIMFFVVFPEITAKI